MALPILGETVRVTLASTAIAAFNLDLRESDYP